MSFAKASVKRFNEDHNDAPAPNAYDAKMPAKKVSSVSLAKDNLPRFQEPKVVVIQDCCLVKLLLNQDVGPGPGQYLVPPTSTMGAKSKSGKLMRSASFRFCPILHENLTI